MSEQKEVILAIGTNIEQEKNMFVAKQLLMQLFHGIIFSSELWTSPIDVSSDGFLNCLAYAKTPHGHKQVLQAIKQIEHRCGVSLAMKHAGLVKIDIDLLLYDDRRYHEKDWGRHYVKSLLKEFANKNIYPATDNQ